MNTRAFTLSLIIAFIAMFMTWSYIDSKENEFAKKYGNLKPVVVAKVNIKELEVIDDSKVQLISVPEKFRMPGYTNMEEVVNTIAAMPIIKGEQITKPRVTQPGARTGLANQVSIGKRAYALRVDASQSVSKLIKPGDRVDILALFNLEPGKIEKMRVKTVLQDVLVLSTGKKVTNHLPLAYEERSEKDVRRLNLNTYTNFNTVALELTPAEVQKMIFIVSTGQKVNLSLRNNDDREIDRIPASSVYDVVGRELRTKR